MLNEMSITFSLILSQALQAQQGHVERHRCLISQFRNNCAVSGPSRLMCEGLLIPSSN